MPFAADVQFDGSQDHDDMLVYRPQCVERDVMGMGVTYVHGYTGQDIGAWRHVAEMIAREVPEARDGKQPSPEVLRMAQAIVVCRTAAGGEHRTFTVHFGGERQAWEAFRRLPGSWVESVCRDSDALTLIEYHPPHRDGAADEAAEHTLHELLTTDEKLWQALDYCSARLFGVPLVDCGQPLAEVLTLLDREIEARSELVGALGQLAAAAIG